MKLIGHVSTAVLAATPVILARGRLPALATPDVSDFELLWWTGLWAAVPDLDILLCRFTPIKHRGFASHSLLTALVVGALVTLGAVLAARGGISPEAARLFTPLTVLLAVLGVVVHLLGDAMTKTGVPLLYPGQKWHIPLIGGYAAFDNYFLNAIPLALAGGVVIGVFGLDPGALRGLGRWRDFAKLLP